MSDDSHEYDEEVFITISEVPESLVLGDPLYKKGFEAGAASRDAEVATLREQIDNLAVDITLLRRQVSALEKQARSQEVESLRQHIDIATVEADRQFQLGLKTTYMRELNDAEAKLANSQKHVLMLRDELLWHKEHTYNPFEPDNQCNAHKRICKALAATEQRQ